jgi:hypothetical protein
LAAGGGQEESLAEQGWFGSVEHAAFEGFEVVDAAFDRAG